jgi:alpha-amylase
MTLSSKTDAKRNVVFYFQVHQPRRLKVKSFFDIGSDTALFNDSLNREVMERVALSCYLPTNSLLLKLIKKHPNIRIAFSISGVTIEQFEEYAPEVLQSFRDLADTGCVEFLGETYFHSLASLMPGHEFEIQALKHADLIEKHFGKRPVVFRNTELIYNNEIGRRVSQLGFTGIFTDGAQKLLQNKKSAHQLHRHPEEAIKILLRDYVLSDDIAFRFNQNGHKLSADQYVSWLRDIPTFEPIVNIAMDYETFGEHQKKDTGIFDFLKKMLTALAKDSHFRMLTPSEAIQTLPSDSTLSAPEHISWADQERDLSAWLGNDIQKDALNTAIKLEKHVKSLGDAELLRTWRMLLTSDHFYYMSTKRGSDGDVHNYFSPYPSPYEAFINYMNVITQFSVVIEDKKSAEKVLRKKAEKLLSLVNLDS